MAQLLVQDIVVPAMSVALKIDKDVITIGRSVDCDVRLTDPAVSRRHATVTCGPDGWIVEDCGSARGTFIDGVRIADAVVIPPSTVICIGRYRIVLEPKRSDEGRDTDPPASKHVGDVLIGKVGLAATVRQVERLAQSDSIVLVTGESGTGKELTARLLHQLSRRSTGPYVTVNCPAIPAGMAEYELFGVESRTATGVEGRIGRIESAAGGTILFDEIGDMALDIQAKILRFLQDGKIDRVGGRSQRTVDVRVIAATHRSLDEAVAGGAFRSDLLHRLRALTIHIPPLRDRREDLDELIEHFLQTAVPQRRLSARARQYLEEYDFPGNVRELEHMLARGHLLAEGQEIEVDDLRAEGWDGDVDETIRPRDNPVSAARSNDEGHAEEHADDLYDAVVRGHRSFWDVVHRPFRRGTLSADTVRMLIDRAYGESRQSYRRVARLFHIDEQRGYRRFVDFLRRSGLGPVRMENAKQKGREVES